MALSYQHQPKYVPLLDAHLLLGHRKCEPIAGWEFHIMSSKGYVIFSDMKHNVAQCVPSPF